MAHGDAAARSDLCSLEASELGLNQSMLVYDNAEANVSRLQRFGHGQPLQVPVCGKVDFQLYHMVPPLGNKWFLLGVVGKWVPVSKARVQGLIITDADVVVKLAGCQDEPINMVFQDPEGTLISVICTVPQTGQLAMSAANRSCIHV